MQPTRLASSVQTQHQQAHFFRSEDLIQQLGDRIAHDGVYLRVLEVGGALRQGGGIYYSRRWWRTEVMVD